MTIPQLVAHWAATTPDAPAILAPGRTALTFTRLRDGSEIVGLTLAAAGVQREDHVAIVLPNGPEMAVAFVGVTGAAVAAPLNPAYRAAEFSSYFDDLRPRALITQHGLDSPARIEARRRHIPVLELMPQSGASAGAFTFAGHSAPSTRMHQAAMPSDAALVLHTSGTTSRPRMVPLTHANLSISARNIALSLALTTADRCLNVMPLFHIHGLVGALLSSLAAGASVMCTPGFHAMRVLGWLDEHQPTWYTAVPTMHQSIAARAGQAAAVRHSLRFIRSSSAALAPALMQTLESIFAVPVLEAYGMTEASHQIAINPGPPGQRKAGSVGRPSGPDVAILDPSGHHRHCGERGEIALRGVTITSGYIGAADANQCAFSDGWFRTGDEGYVDEDGYVFITARIKELINRGGEKISPREVEDVLLAHPSVADAVAFAVPHVRLGEDIAAAVVTKPGMPLDDIVLRRFAASQLAEFKVPRLIRVVLEIPKGATGKIQRIGMADRLGIRAGDIQQSGRTAFRAPGSPLETELLTLWREVLAVADIGVDDDFFAIGGDSILATTLALRVADSLGTQIPIVDFVASPTIAGMAAAIAQSASSPVVRGPAAGVLVPIQPEGTRPPIFCAPPMDGSLMGFSRLSHYLGRQQPVWGFAPPQLGPGQWSYSIEGVASRYVEAMRAQQPTGPYTILGDCFGGFVAYDMACQLRRGGDAVDVLVMVDTFFRSGWQQEATMTSLLAARVRHGLARARTQLSTIRGLDGAARLAYVRDRGADFARHLRHRALQTLYNASIRMGVKAPAAAREIRYANMRAEQRYQPERFAGRTAVVSTTAPSAGFYAVRLSGWEGTLTGEVHAIPLPGAHSARFLDSGAQALAALLAPVLDEARGGGRAS